MTRTVLIFGLILLAAFLPLAAVPVVLVLCADALIVVARITPFESADTQPVALLALTRFRAPPSR